MSHGKIAPIRIGIVTYDFYPRRGGQGRHTYELWRRLASDPRLELRVFSPSVNDLPGHVTAGAAPSRLASHLGFSLAVAFSLEKWRRRFGIDVFHFNGGPGGVVLLKSAPRPLLYTAHHTYAQQSRLVPGQSWKRAFVRFEAASYAQASLVAAVTPSTAKAVEGELGRPSPRVIVVPSGIDENRFCPAEAPKLEGSVLFVGRLDARKNLIYLLDAWRHVRRRAPNARLYVIGDGPLRRKAERFIGSNGLSASVTLLGKVSEDELVRWYRQAWCVAVPSIFEGLGLAALEALACATPVVAADTDGLRDVVRDGIDGLLAPLDDAVAFADALAQVLGGNGRIDPARVRDVHETYSWDTIAARYRELYEELAS